MDDIIIHLFCRIADELKDVKQHHQANLHPSEIATIGVLNAIKGDGYRVFYRFIAGPRLDPLVELMNHLKARL